MALHTCIPLMPEYLLNLVLQILCQFWKPTNILPIPILHALQLVSSICIQDSSPSQCTKNKRAIQHQWVNQNSQLQIRSSILYFMMLGLRLCKLPPSLSLSARFLLVQPKIKPMSIWKNVIQRKWHYKSMGKDRLFNKEQVDTSIEEYKFSPSLIIHKNQNQAVKNKTLKLPKVKIRRL